MKFEELGLGQETLDILRESGFETPSEIQEKTIPLVLAGKDVIGGAATGSGKTLAFASPIVEKVKSNGKVQALILTPTRELAEQVAEAIKKFSGKKDLKVLSVYGGVSIETQIRKLHNTDVVVGTPGRILDHLQRRTLRLTDVKFLVLDEVDRMFDMGFHRDVEKIISQCSAERQTMLFSATISADVDRLAKKYTKNAVEVAVKSHIDPSKLRQVYYDISGTVEKFSLLVHLLNKEDGHLVMVFCSTRRNVDFVTYNLNKVGINAMATHGGLSQNQRTNVLEQFHGKGVGVLVCTDVAARGLDIKGVSHVYNYDLPPTSTEYIHRIGRTARAGTNGIAISLLTNRDYDNLNNILMDRQLFISPQTLPDFKRIQIEMPMHSETRGRFGNRSFGGRSRQREGSESGGRSFGRPRGNRHDHGPRSGPRKDRKNKFSSMRNGSDHRRSPTSEQGQRRSNFHSKARRGNY